MVDIVGNHIGSEGEDYSLIIKKIIMKDINNGLGKLKIVYQKIFSWEI